MKSYSCSKTMEFFRTATMEGIPPVEYLSLTFMHGDGVYSSNITAVPHGVDAGIDFAIEFVPGSGFRFYVGADYLESISDKSGEGRILKPVRPDA